MNIATLLDMAADAVGDRVIIGRRAEGLTPIQLRSLARGGARLVSESSADAILYLAVNGPAFPVALFAAAHAGVPLVPVSYRLGTEQMDGILARHPNALVVADAGARITGRTPDQFLADAQRMSTAAVGEPNATDAPALVIYTSGTTSTPKGVVLRHANLTSYILATIEFAGASPEDAGLTSVPPYHIAGVANVLSSVFAGRRTIALESFSPEGWLNLVRAEGITNAFLVPTMLARIVELESLDRAVPSLRFLAYGGARMPGKVITKAMELWPQVDFCNAYGLTETSSTIALLGADDHRAAMTSPDPEVRARLGSVGLVVPGIEVEVRDDHGGCVPIGVAGRIWVRGEQVSCEYAGARPGTDDVAFFDTRDEGYLDSGGYLFVAGRADDTIIRAAENIAPAEIEDVLLDLAGVADAAVVGVPDEEWGQRIEAAVVAEPGVALDTEELRSALRRALRASRTPDRIVCWPELPRTETGKLLRRVVVQRLMEK